MGRDSGKGEERAPEGEGSLVRSRNCTEARLGP